MRCRTLLTLVAFAASVAAAHARAAGEPVTRVKRPAARVVAADLAAEIMTRAGPVRVERLAFRPRNVPMAAAAHRYQFSDPYAYSSPYAGGWYGYGWYGYGHHYGYGHSYAPRYRTFTRSVWCDYPDGYGPAVEYAHSPRYRTRFSRTIRSIHGPYPLRWLRYR